ncbi:MAG: hypothetical protein Q8N68_01310 [bacterium]|nr:hypothetical protein [bacterium]
MPDMLDKSEKKELEPVELEKIDADGEPLPKGILDGYEANLEHARNEAKSSRIKRRLMKSVDRWHREGVDVRRKEDIFR